MAFPDFGNPLYGGMYQPPPDGLTDEERQYRDLYMALMSQQGPPEPSNWQQNLGGALQQMPGPQAQFSTGENFISGLLRGLGGYVSGRGEQKQKQQALKNQQNIAATQAILGARAKRLGEGSEFQRAKERAAGTAAGTPAKAAEPTVKAPGGPVGRDTPLGQHIAAGGSAADFLKNKEPREPRPAKPAPPFDIDASLKKDARYNRASQAEQKARDYQIAQGNDPMREPTFQRAYGQTFDAIKQHVTNLIRQAKTREEANAILESAFGRYPDLQQSPMIVKVARDKVREFGGR
jgi:hypothetical protein